MTGNLSDNAGQSDLVTVAEAAGRLGKSERTIRRLISSGKLNTVEIGGKTCVQLAGIESSNSHRHVSGNDVQTPAIIGQDDRHMTGVLSDELVDAMRDTIRRQDAMIASLEADKAHLRSELQGKQSTIDGLLRMFPLPTAGQSHSEQEEKPTSVESSASPEQLVQKSTDFADDKQPQKQGFWAKLFGRSS